MLAQQRASPWANLGERFLQRRQPGLEAQLANFADEIAYNNHDVDDGIRAGLITVDQLLGVPLFAGFHREVAAKHPGLDERRLVFEILRRMINELVSDLIDSSAARLRDSGVRRSPTSGCIPGALIGFSEAPRTSTADSNRSCAITSTSTTRSGA